MTSKKSSRLTDGINGCLSALAQAARPTCKCSELRLTARGVFRRHNEAHKADLLAHKSNGKLVRFADMENIVRQPIAPKAPFRDGIETRRTKMPDGCQVLNR